MLHALRPDATDKLLDVGCGTGSFMIRMAATGHRGALVGLDASPAAFATHGSVPGVRRVLADLRPAVR